MKTPPTLGALFLVLVLSTASVSRSSAQIRQCVKSETDTPVVREFRLGMTVDEAELRYEYLKFEKGQKDETGYFATDVRKLFLSESEARGIAKLNLGFLDDHLVSIIVVYNDETSWKSAEQFAGAISATLDLPMLWVPKIDRRNPNRIVGLEMVCGKITYGVGTPNGELIPFQSPVFLLFRNDTKPIRDGRRERLDEMRRRTFKP